MPDSPEEPSMAEFAKRLENAVRKNAGRPADGQRKEDKPPPDPRVPSTYPGMEEALSRMRPAEAVLNNPEDRTELGITYWAPPEKSAPPPSAENVLNSDLSNYGYRRSDPGAMAQSGRPTEKANVPEPSPPPDHSAGTHPSLRDDIFTGGIGTLIAAPLCDASWHAIVTEAEYIRGAVGLLVGIPTGVAGLTYHWWKTKLPEVGRNSLVWGPLAVLLAFIYVAGPEIYRRATLPPVAIPSASGSSVVPNPVPALPTVPQHFYSAAQREELANRIATIYGLMNTDIVDIAASWSTIASRNLTGISKHDVEQLLKVIDGLQHQTLAVNDQLWMKAINDNPNFKGELRE
jgi:hypothetical protein